MADGDWKHGMFGCFDNCGLCIWTFLCPCIAFGKQDSRPLVLTLFDYFTFSKVTVSSGATTIFRIVQPETYVSNNRDAVSNDNQARSYLQAHCYISYVVISGKNAAALGDSCCLNTCFFFIPIFNIYKKISMRGRIREAQNIDGTCCGDVLWSLLCGFCTFMQERQECVEGLSGEEMARE